MADEEKTKPKKQINDEVILMFRENRTFELHLGGQIVARFEGREKRRVSRRILDHPDFHDGIKEKFSIQEIE